MVSNRNPYCSIILVIATRLALLLFTVPTSTYTINIHLIFVVCRLCSIRHGDPSNRIHSYFSLVEAVPEKSMLSTFLVPKAASTSSAKKDNCAVELPANSSTLSSVGWPSRAAIVLDRQTPSWNIVNKTTATVCHLGW